MDHTSRDLERSTKYIEWVPVPARWIERRLLIFTALRNPGYILLHLVAGPPLAAVVGITVGVLLELVGVPDGNGIWAFVVGALLVASLMGIRLLSFTVFNASGVHIFRFGSSDAGGGARTSPGWPFARRRVWTFRRRPMTFTASHLPILTIWRCI